MVLDKHRDIPIRLIQALKSGVSRELIARHSGLMPGEATRVIDRMLDGTATSFFQVTAIERGLDHARGADHAPGGALT